MSDTPLDSLRPSWKPLFDQLVENVDRFMLRDISHADYGEDSDAHFAALRDIAAGQLSVPLEWVPHEVLSLTRFTHPDDDHEHWLRLFSCCVLLRTDEPPHEEFGHEVSVLRFTDSAIALGLESTIHARQFLCWYHLRQVPTNYQSPYVAIAILLLSIELNDLSESTADYLESVVRYACDDDWNIWQLFGRLCGDRKEWLVTVRDKIRESTLLSGRLQEFGKYLLLEGDDA